MQHTSVQPAHVEDAAPDSWLDAALAWCDGAIESNGTESSASFFELEPKAQLVAIDALRSSLRSALHVTGIDTSAFVALTNRRYRAWFLGGMR